MGDVTQFPANENSEDDDCVWRCDCGCMSFLLHVDGTVICARCDSDTSAGGAEWRRMLPEVPSVPRVTEVGDMSHVVMDDTGAALRRVLARADFETTSFVVVVQQNGASSVWGGNCTTEEELAWLDRRLADVRKMLTKG